MGVGFETSMGGAQGRFPSTRWTLIIQAREGTDAGRREALEQLCQLYWKPVYVHIRAARSLSNEDAKDLTQEFFIEILDGSLLAKYDPEKGSLRGFLRGALRVFLAAQHRSDQAMKRGGGKAPLHLDVESLDPVASGDRDHEAPDRLFEEQWARSVLENGYEKVRIEFSEAGKESHLRVFEQYVLQRSPGAKVTYAQVGANLGLEVDQVRRMLIECRRRLREVTLDLIRDYVASESLVTEEAARILENLG